MSGLPAQARARNSTDLNPVLLGTALVATAAALFGTLSFVTRSAAEAGMGALPFIVWRGAIATVALLVVVWLLALRSSQRTTGSLPPNRRGALIAACLVGAALNIAMFQAFLLTTVAIVLIVFYTFPAIVTIAAVPLYGERLDRVRISALALSAVGLVLPAYTRQRPEPRRRHSRCPAPPALQVIDRGTVARPKSSLSGRRLGNTISSRDQGTAEGDAAPRRQARHPIRRRGGGCLGH